MILCNCDDCFFWKELTAPRRLKYGRYKESLSEYTGKCGRPGGIGIMSKTIETHDVVHKIHECYGFTNRKVSGHTDFSAYPQGGNIPDPIPGDTAYH